ncbi:MAG: SDR family NAD(P)-dependent oxidoreductase [Actinomycetota bacterium]|nr:SDR family NAD(P)-dependent oxidoreductase [Actinomycetota bacterium]
MRDLRGKTVLITGAASGIGRELALASAREGAIVLLVDVDAGGLKELERLLRAAGTENRSYLADISDREVVRGLAGKVYGEFEGLDILINNAGVFVWADFADTTLEDWEWLMRVNLWGPILTIKAFLPKMIDRGRGHIVNLASLGGLVTMPTLSGYSTTKFGLVGLTETLQHELEPHNIAVTLVCPGNIRTPIVDHIVVRGYDREKLIRVSYGIIPRLAPDRAANRILKGIKKDKAMVTLTPSAHIMWYIKRISPGLYRVMLGRPIRKIYDRMR